MNKTIESIQLLARFWKELTSRYPQINPTTEIKNVNSRHVDIPIGSCETGYENIPVDMDRENSFHLVDSDLSVKLSAIYIPVLDTILMRVQPA